MPLRHLDGVEGLRALAAVSVVFTHWAGLNLPLATDPTFGVWFSQLNIGVSIFFVLSGFLLYRPYAVAHAADSAGPGLRGYFTRRFLRIFPAYWVALGFDLWLGSRNHLTSPGGWLTHLSLTQTFVGTVDGFNGMLQAWTLSVELGFYLLLPVFAGAVGHLLRRSTSAAVASASGAGAVGAAHAANSGHQATTPDALPVARTARLELALIGAFAAVGLASMIWLNLVADWRIAVGTVTLLPLRLTQWLAMFGAGMALALCWSRVAAGTWSPTLWHLPGRNPAGCWAAALVLFALLNQGIGLTTGDVEPWQWIVRHLLHLSIAVLLLLPIISHTEAPSRLRSALANRGVVAVGLGSYGIYLWHVGILEALARTFDAIATGDAVASVLVIGLALPAAIAIGYLSYRLIEEPTRRLARRLSRSDPRRPSDRGTNVSPR